MQFFTTLVFAGIHACMSISLSVPTSELLFGIVKWHPFSQLVGIVNDNIPSYLSNACWKWLFENWMIIATRPHDTHTLVSTWLLRFTSFIKMHRIRAVISSMRFVYWSMKWLQFLLTSTYLALFYYFVETKFLVLLYKVVLMLLLFHFN